LVTFRVPSQVGPVIRLGALLDNKTEDRIVDLTAGFAAYLGRETDEPTPRELANLRVPPDMIGWLRAGHAGLAAARNALDYVRSHPEARGLDDENLVYARSDISILAPLPRPTSFRDFSIYEEHMTRQYLDPTHPDLDPTKPNERPIYKKKPIWYRVPPYYKGSCSSIRGPEDPIPWPYYTKRLDAELELGIIIGKTGRNLTVEQAKEHIAGYTIVVDSSCRDGYEREPYGPTKRKDFHTAVGPWLVTADEVDLENLECSLEIEGQQCFKGSSSAPHSFSPAQLVAYASDTETLSPGDLLSTGTVSYGCSMDHHRWVKVGETMTFSVDGLGSMSLKVVSEPSPVRHVEGMAGLLTHRP
jgi:2-keto-4-pentenoate hydratase/2-oxohepta-3-ene-1,7-dioic acid hydratase in catechol pathway